MRIPVTPNPPEHWVLSGCWILAIQKSVQRNTIVLICNLFIIDDVEHLLIWFPSHIFFGEVSIQISCLFFKRILFLLVSFKHPSEILNNTPLSNMSFANIFFGSVSCSLILLKTASKMIIYFFTKNHLS